MDLRHVRYFVAVAESGSLRAAAEERLHTTQPSLGRQIRDLEAEVGTPLFTRSAKGVDLTDAGKTFLQHARALLAQADATVRAARQIAHSAKPSFALGFLIGHDTTWVPRALRVLRDALPDLHVIISTQNSPQLGAALLENRIDAAFMRREDGGPELAFERIADEAIEVFLPRDHRLAALPTIAPSALVGETFIGISGAAFARAGGATTAPAAPALRRTIDRYLQSQGVDVQPSHEVDHLGTVMSLIESTRGFALLPAYARTFVADSVVHRPLRGSAPTIDLSIGYRKTNLSPVLQTFLARTGTLEDVGEPAHPPAGRAAS